MLTVTDDYSRKTWILLTKERFEVYDKFDKLKAELELEVGRITKAIRIDNAPKLIKLGNRYEGL